MLKALETRHTYDLSEYLSMPDGLYQIMASLPYALDLSKATMSIIKQNIVFSILIKVVAMTLVFPGWLTLWMAVLSDTGAAVLVTLNALRLLRKRHL